MGDDGRRVDPSPRGSNQLFLLQNGLPVAAWLSEIPNGRLQTLGEGATARCL